MLASTCLYSLSAYVIVLQSSSTAKSRNYPADTAKQRFMEETYNKETAIRLGWFFSPTGQRLSRDSMTSRRKEVYTYTTTIIIIIIKNLLWRHATGAQQRLTN